MIQITRKEDCVGCNGCRQICPKQCILMNEDEQGFLYPEVNQSECINCGLCEKVCPVINKKNTRFPDATYAAKNNDEEIQKMSSSGGIFFALAKRIIDDGGVVFGACFDRNWEVVHSYTETIEGLKKFQRSKYVQSRIGNSYRDVLKFLQQGRKVLFSGTPCQIAGLNLFLRKDYGELLLKVDFACHGVPSPGVWRIYLDYIRTKVQNIELKTDSIINNESSVITDINFRDKRLGWEKYGFSVHVMASNNRDGISRYKDKSVQGKELLFEPYKDNLYMQGFLKDLYIRPSCYSCPVKCGKSYSDITMGDFWGIGRMYPKYYQAKLYSLLLLYAPYQNKFISDIKDVTIREVSYSAAVKYNRAIKHSAVKPKQYDDFWTEYYSNGISAIRKFVLLMEPSFTIKFYRRFKKAIRMICYRFKNQR